MLKWYLHLVVVTVIRLKEPGEKSVVECCWFYLIFLSVKCFMTLGCLPHTSERTNFMCTLFSKSSCGSSKSHYPWKNKIRQLQRRFPLCNWKWTLQWQVYFTSKLNFSLSTFPLLLFFLERESSKSNFEFYLFWLTRLLFFFFPSSTSLFWKAFHLTSKSFKEAKKSLWFGSHFNFEWIASGRTNLFRIFHHYYNWYYTIAGFLEISFAMVQS